MKNLRNILRPALYIVWVVVAVWVLLKYNHIGPFGNAPESVSVKPEITDTTKSLVQAVAEVEQDKKVNGQIKQQLVDQGYPEDAVEGLLAQGAQKATGLKNIASVEESYGTPWNEPLHVGDYELVGLYLIGNDEAHRFVLGQYQDRTGEHVIYLHMSRTEPLTTLQAGLVYSHKKAEKHYTAYINDKGDVAGIQFAVELNEGKGVVNYVATTSGTLTQSDIDSFISSVVDGSII